MGWSREGTRGGGEGAEVGWIYWLVGWLLAPLHIPQVHNHGCAPRDQNLRGGGARRVPYSLLERVVRLTPR